jgi:urease accessory protein
VSGGQGLALGNAGGRESEKLVPSPQPLYSGRPVLRRFAAALSRVRIRSRRISSQRERGLPARFARSAAKGARDSDGAGDGFGKSDAGPNGEGWRARLELAFAPSGHRTVLARRRHEGPLAVQRAFYPEGGVCHVYLLHPPGGIVGGDRLDVRVRALAGAHALVTTPGATKCYRSAGPLAEQRQHLQVEADGALEWLPQETLWFAGARGRSTTRVDLDPGSRFIGWEVQCLGRPACGETFDGGEADLALSVHRAGRPLLLERLRVQTSRDLARASGLRGLAVTGTLVAAVPDAAPLEALAETLRDTLPDPPRGVAGVTVVDGLLVARCLAPYAEPARRYLEAVWAHLRPVAMGRPAVAPRIWAT